MADSTVSQPNFTPDLQRIELAQRALWQVEALLPIAQNLAEKSGDSVDAMLGLLGRVREMNDVAMELLSEAASGAVLEDSLERIRLEILGRREVRHAN